MFNTVNSELNESYKDMKFRTFQINKLLTVFDYITSMVIRTSDKNTCVRI